MREKETSWYSKWFNEDYLKLYSYRDTKEAEFQVDFLVRALNLEGNEKILDLGCGVGRHALALAVKGFEVLGVDISPYFIKIATRLQGQNPSLPVRFRTGDMLHLEDLGTFDVVINMFTSFGYFEKEEENVKVLQTIRDHLFSGGKFFLDYLHPDHVRKNLIPNEERDVNGEKVIIRKRLEGSRVIKTISFPGRTYEEKVMLYTRDQIEKMLSSNGFHVIDVWNDYEGNPWREEGDRQLFYSQSL